MSKGLQRGLTTLAVAAGAYSLLGFLILPGVAQRVVNQQLAQYAAVPASLQRIELNPFTLRLDLWGLQLGDDTQRQVGFEHLGIDLQWNSLWSGALHLASVELNKPHTELLFAKDGTLNLTQLFKLPASQGKTEEPAAEPFPLRLDHFALNGGSLHFKDERPTEAIEFTYDSLDLSLHKLSTLPDDNADLTLMATGPNGGKLEWQGEFSLSPLASTGSLKLSDAKLKAFWPYVRDAVPLDLQEGTLSASTNYQFSLLQGTALKLEQLAVSLAPFAIQSPEQKPLLKLERLDISNSSLDLAQKQVIIGQIRSQNLEAWAAREKDGQLDWQKLLATPAKPAASEEPSASPAEPAITATTALATTTPTPAAGETKANDQATAAPAEPGTDKPWQITLVDTQLRGYRAHLEDRVPERAVKLDVGPLDLDLQNFVSSGDQPFQLKLDSGLGKQGKLSAAGQVLLQPLGAQLQVTTKDIDLRLAQAYLQPFVRLELRSGLLGSDLKVDLKSAAPLVFSVAGSAEVHQLHTLDTLKNRDFLKWQRLQLDGLQYVHGDQLRIEKIRLQQPYARFIINEDLTTNVNELLIPQPASPAPSAPGKPLGIHIGGIAIADGSANFADFSLSPNFATAIQRLEGHIGTIDSRSPKAAAVDIKGRVDRYAPVSIKGALNPFAPLDKLDIATSFQHVELTTLTPYSGKFAGYRIKKGRLNLDLHYRIEKGQLNADNKLVLEQLQLGEQVDSKDAVDLPIRLAVALLKDSEGKISIELPVSGDLNNPEFSVMPIVWQTLRNLVVRAVQAPFNFIAGLVGGEQADLSQVSFAPGSDSLDKQATGTLETLAKALQERPALRLDVEGVSAKANDGPLLASQRLQEEYQSNYYRMLQRSGDKVPASPSELEVPDGIKPSLLEGIYRARLKQQPPTEWKELGDAERSARLEQAVLANWQGSELLLRQLAQDRARSIKDFLVSQGLADERIFLLDVALSDTAEPGRTASALHLDSE
ncbi:hypothetical protein CK486_09720 [Pseudomonas sp. HAR-UPW-AIA-41]|uniref:DUF748 domain-containing protein n=1 Tax=Pseudomonas sp. HAR-UPW-AIA-41 TaxID=1985301 RepID=UPI000BB36330|nr:DUF748 domain-containing protein [Pseudomonas sp. HAR-UPW-AIA-41]PAV47988.1 hypothetical protein CK486_09720 [Pseudomonas sp. HAR-UPW-AIA-41]